MQKLLMIGPVPPPYTGQSISFEKLKESLINEQKKGRVNLILRHINTAPKRSGHITGRVSLYRFLETSAVVIRCILCFAFYRPDVIYLTKGSTKAGFFRDLCILISKTLLSRKSVFIVHLKGGNYDSFYYSCSEWWQRSIRFFLRNVDKIIVLGQSLVKMYDFFPQVESKITVIENALTNEEFTPGKTENHDSVDKVNIIYLSNLIYTKGYGHILDACKILIERGVTNFYMRFAGAFMRSPDDPVDIDMKNYQEKFLTDIASSGLSNYITYMGVVTGDSKVNYLRDADVFVLPTQYHVEGQPVSIIEAMAYGCAIVTTNYRSIPDLVEEGGNSVYVNYADSQSIADALERYITNLEFLKRSSARSIELYQTKFKWDVHFNKMKAAFGID